MGLILGSEHLAVIVNQPQTSTGTRRTPIKVAMLSLPPRTQSLLEFFLTNAGRSAFVASVEEQAETAIFDLDTPASHAHWLSFHERTGRPGIALAVKPHEVSGALWVQKPVTPAALLSAATTLQAGATMPPAPAAITVPAPVPEPLQAVEAPAAAPAPQAVPEEAMKPSLPASELPELPVVSDVLVVSAAPVAAPTLTAVVAPSAEQQTTESAEAQLTATQTTASAEPVTSEPVETHPAPAAAVHAEPAGIESPAPADGRQGGFLGVWRRLMGIAPRKAAAEPPESPAGLPASTSAGEPPVPNEAEAAPSAAAIDAQAQTALAAAGGQSVGEQETLPQAESAPREQALMEDVSAESVADSPSPEENALPRDDAQPGIVQPSFFGSRPDATTTELAQGEGLRYDPEAYLVGLMREAYLVSSKWQVPTQFACERGLVAADAERNELTCGFSASDLEALYAKPLAQRPKVHTLTSQQYERFKQASEALGHATRLRLDDQLWRAALCASAGRMPAKADATRTVYLSRWPNLTRITAIPHAPRISALWALRGAAVVDTARQLGIAQRYVIGFYSAAWALNLLTEDGSHIRRAQRKGTRNRGLLTRLLGWLRG